MLTLRKPHKGGIVSKAINGRGGGVSHVEYVFYYSSSERMLVLLLLFPIVMRFSCCSLTESGYFSMLVIYIWYHMLRCFLNSAFPTNGYRIQSLCHTLFLPRHPIVYTSSGDSSLSIPNKLSISFSAIFSSCATWPVTSVYAYMRA